MIADRVPPHCIESEKGALGSMLLDPTKIGEWFELFGATDIFYDLRHKMIFEAMAQLSEENKPVDIVSVSTVLKDKLQDDQTGGIVYLVELSDCSPSGENLTFFADRLREKYTRRSIIRNCTSACSEAYDAESKVETVLDGVEQSILAIADMTAGKDENSIQEIGRRALARMEWEYKNGNKPTGLASGFRRLDGMLRGYQNKELNILAARPGIGKTAFVMDVVANVVLDQKIPVAVFNYEMSYDSLFIRTVFSRAGISRTKFLDQRLTPMEFSRLGDVSAKLAASPLYMEGESEMNILQLKAKARRLKKRNGIKLLVIDYLQLVSGVKYTSNRNNEVGEVSRGLKMLASELDIPIIALSQLNREVEKGKGRPPNLSDLRESGSIEQDANTVMFLHDPDPDIEDKSSQRVINALVRKNRNGPCGDFELMFTGDQTKFENHSGIDPADHPTTR